MQKITQRRQVYRDKANIGMLFMALFVAMAFGVSFVIIRSTSSVHAATPPDNCFDFDSGTGTINGYYENEGNNGSNPACTKTLDIPSTIGGVAVTHLSTGSFENMGLTSVTIPNSVLVMDYNAFAGNPLTSVTIGTSDFAGTPQLVVSANFGYMPTLTNVTLGNNVLRVSSGAFASSGITSLNLGESVQVVEFNALSSIPVTSLTIPDSMRTIGSGTLSNLTNLTSLDLGEGIETIGSSAFSFSKITELVIPNSVTSMSGGVFSNTTLLTDVTIGTDDFSGPPTLVLGSGFLGGSFCFIDTVKIGNNVSEISGGVFYNCPITSLDLGESVEQINTSFMWDGNNPAKKVCIETLVIPSSVKVLSSSFNPADCVKNLTIGDSGFTGIAELDVSNVFTDASSLESLTIGGNVKSIVESFGSTPALTQLELGNGLESIVSAFYNNKLTALEIPGSVTNVTDSFNKASRLDQLTVAGSPTIIFSFIASNLTRVFFEAEPTIPDSGSFTLAGVTYSDTDNSFIYDDYDTDVIPVVRYVPIYVNNPGALADYAVTESDGPIGGYLINAVQLRIEFRNAANNELASVFQQTGPTLNDFLVRSNPTEDMSLYYRIGDVVTVTPPAVDGYATPNPISITLSAPFVHDQGSVYTVTYVSNNTNLPGVPDTGFADNTQMLWSTMLIGLSVLVLLSASGAVIYRLYKK